MGLSITLAEMKKAGEELSGRNNLKLPRRFGTGDPQPIEEFIDQFENVSPKDFRFFVNSILEIDHHFRPEVFHG